MHEPPHTKLTPIDAVLQEQSQRWQRGERVLVEQFLDRLGADADALLTLLYQEIVLRQRRGETPLPAEYLARFPHLQTQICAQFEIHQAIQQHTTLDPAKAPRGAAALSSSATDVPTLPPMAAFTDSPPAALPADAQGKAMPAGSAPEGYEILGELGRGGMGVVYQARHLKLHRVVALKMILAGGHAGPDDLARFRTEAQAVARLQHPGIVQIFEIGEHQDLPYFTLEYCDGGSLAKLLSSTPLQPRAAARLVEQLARAMHAAHQQHIIHRDLKPANVLLVGGQGAGTNQPALLTTHQPKITDFGLAKKLDDVGQTHSGAVMGTPSYMAPEQAMGKSKEIGPPADVYALGAILYECLTGRPPFKAASSLDTILQVVGNDAVPPRQLQPQVPRDLETICLKCLEKAAGKRYASALALAEDLHRYQAGEPIQARPVGAVERSWRWCKRKPALAGMLAAVSLLVITLLTGAVWYVQDQAVRRAHAQDQVIEIGRREEETNQANQKLKVAVIANQNLAKANKEAANANEALAIANKDVALANERLFKDEKRARDHAEDLLATSTMQLAKSRFEDNNAALAEDLLEQVPTRFRLAPWRLLKNYVAGSLCTLHGHAGLVTGVAIAADGQVLASASGDKTVKLWDARTGQELRTLRGHTREILSVAFVAHGQVLASASYDGTVKLWDARTGQELRTLRGHMAPVFGVAFAGDGQVLASASVDQTVKLWDARTGQELRTLRGHTSAVTSVSFAGDGQVLASASWDQTVKLWDARTGQELRTLGGHTGFVNSVAFAVDGQILASASEDKTIKLWDARTGQELRTLRGHMRVSSVAFAADGQVLASASEDGTIKLWDARTGQELRTLRGHANLVMSVAFAADGQVLASASWDQTVKLWDARTGPELRTLRGHTGFVKCVAFAADGQVLASASGDQTVKLWDARTGQELRTLRGHTKQVMSVAFAADGQVLASTSEDNTVKLWDARTGQELRTLRGHTHAVASVAFGGNGQVLASASVDQTVKLWDARTGQELRTLQGHTDTVMSVAFSPDGQVLASASNDNTVKLWDARTGQELRTLRGHTAEVQSVAFAADGKSLWSREYGGTVLAWDVATGKRLHDKPPALAWSFGSGAWSPNGSVLAVGQANGLILLVPREISDKEHRFRLLATAPDLYLHREKAEQAEVEKQPYALAFRLGRYLAGQSYYARAPHDAASVGTWLATGPQPLNLLGGLPVSVKTPLHPPVFPNGIACTGVLYKDSGIAPARLLLGTARALQGDPANWLNHAFHGGALYRNGKHAEALAALTRAAELHGKPNPLTHTFLALTYVQMGDTEKAKAALAQVQAGKDAPWEQQMLDRLLQPEIAAALAKAAEKQDAK